MIDMDFADIDMTTRSVVEKHKEGVASSHDVERVPSTAWSVRIPDEPDCPGPPPPNPAQVEDSERFDLLAGMSAISNCVVRVQNIIDMLPSREHFILRRHLLELNRELLVGLAKIQRSQE